MRLELINLYSYVCTQLEILEKTMLDVQLLNQYQYKIKPRARAAKNF